ncbi:kinase-like protein [Pluteus cervinus]|uniref:Kinase-like protein n=1 Tax=Pluteus cervinus TaxID=181527 RepID=A0ACD3BAS6_9AGAR|nr:kinase-like protein [Pluteus cervinus]
MPTATAPSSSPHPFLSSFFTSPPLQQTPDEHSAAQRLVRITSSKSSLNDSEQRFSAAFQSDEQRSRGPTSPFVAPHHQDVVVSASPAAMFLSAFCSPVIQQRSPDEEGEVVAGYTLADIIGYGAFSTIRRAYSTSGGIVAVKIVRRSDLAKQEHTARMRLENEEAVWSSLSHEHILPLFTSLHTSYADFYVTLYCPAGSLFDILKRDGTPALPQDDVGMMFRQVVRGLRYLHEIALFVHRDIKLENILVDEMGICRIGDFGMTRKVGESEEEIDEDDEHQEFFQQQQHGGVHRAVSLAVPSAKYIHSHLTPRNPGGLRHRNSTSSAKPQFPLHNCQPGSLPYAAPELLSRQTSSHLLPHPAQDIWALGVMLYALLTGRLPFSDSFEPRLQMKILNGKHISM